MKRRVSEQLKGFVEFCSNKLNLALIILITIFITIASLVYLLGGNRVRVSLNDQMLHREQVVARAGAKEIKSFIELSGKTLVILSSDTRITSIDNSPQVQEALDEYIKTWNDTPVVEVIIINKEGLAVYQASQTSSSFTPGVSLADRDYFIAAKNLEKERFTIGNPLLPRLGQYQGEFLIPIATPIYKDGEFVGVLAVGIRIAKLTESYLDPLEISAKTNVHLADENGMIISSYIPEITGMSFFDYLEKNPFPGSGLLENSLRKELAVAIEKKEGKFSYIRNKPASKNKFGSWLLSYSVIDFETSQINIPDSTAKHWILAIETPEEDASVFFTPFQVNQTVALTLVIILIVTFSLFVLLSTRYARKEGYADGFVDGKNHDKRK